MQKAIVLSISLLSFIQINAQVLGGKYSLNHYDVHNTITMTNDSNYTDRFHVTEKKLSFFCKPKKDRNYHWFAKNQLQMTQGGYNGKLLHGEYSIHYPDNQLKEKGFYIKGLRSKTWHAWYPNGKLKTVSKWKKGKLHGNYQIYDTEGILVKELKYRKGKEVLPKQVKPKAEKEQTAKPEKESKVKSEPKPVKEKKPDGQK